MPLVTEMNLKWKERRRSVALVDTTPKAMPYAHVFLKPFLLRYRKTPTHMGWVSVDYKGFFKNALNPTPEELILFELETGYEIQQGLVMLREFLVKGTELIVSTHVETYYPTLTYKPKEDLLYVADDLFSDSLILKTNTLNDLHWEIQEAYLRRG